MMKLRRSATVTALTQINALRVKVSLMRNSNEPYAGGSQVMSNDTRYVRWLVTLRLAEVLLVGGANAFAR
jgi:hypothetical protein